MQVMPPAPPEPEVATVAMQFAPDTDVLLGQE
jgi:hypothetical protein